MSQKAYLYVSAVIFAIVGLSHLVRAIFSVPIQAGGVEFPVGLSWGGGVVAIAVCLWGLSLARR